MRQPKEAAPRIYVADLAAYNAGVLHGTWVELSELATVESVREEIQAMLEKSPSREVAEEWRFDDYEGFFEYELNEYEDLDTVVAVSSFIREHGALGAQLLAYCSDPDEARETLEDRYAGSGESLNDWCEQYLEETGKLEEVPRRWRAYLDLERYARDLELGGEVFTLRANGTTHVFWNA